MDDKDEMLVRILEREARLSSRTLSQITGLPISTVHRRVQHLEREGVIKGYKALIDYEKTARPISALLMINLAEVIPGRGHIPKKDVSSRLSLFEEVEEINEVQASNFDLLIRARLASLSKLSELVERIRSIEGIEETSSAIVTNEAVLPPPKFYDKSAR